MRRAIRLFRDLTGLTAVTSVRAADADRDPCGIAPPVHPRCAGLRPAPAEKLPCEAEWQKHLRAGLRTRVVQRHVCPLDLRCACVPIHYRETLVGIAKFVAGPRMTDARLRRAVRVLELVVSSACRDLEVSALSEETRRLRRQVADLRKVRPIGAPGPRGVDLGGVPRSGIAANAHAGSLVHKALDYLDGHYLDPALSLVAVSRQLGVNGKYLTRLFGQEVGQRMRAVILDLRVQHACRLLLDTNQPIKQVAYESGFGDPDHFRRTFRGRVGVAPTTYRGVFTSS
jgi:AraC-like DNA-binding protein